MLERIAAAACPTPENLVIEIGPGRGALTEKLLRRAARVIAIEIDSYLVDHLQRKFAGEDRLQVVQADVLETDLAQWGQVPVVGNLPYYITSPILHQVSRLEIPRAVFLMQKEVAERLVAQPGERAYGFLTVQMTMRAEARLLFPVKPAAFHPPPKVDSAVVLLRPRIREFAIADSEAFLRFVGQCFHQKRKTIRNNLAGTYDKELVSGWPEAGLRAEQLSLQQFAEMYQRVRA